MFAVDFLQPVLKITRLASLGHLHGTSVAEFRINCVGQFTLGADSFFGAWVLLNQCGRWRDCRLLANYFERIRKLIRSRFWESCRALCAERLIRCIRISTFRALFSKRSSTVAAEFLFHLRIFGVALSASNGFAIGSDGLNK
jgi:hypothetical protein